MSRVIGSWKTALLRLGLPLMAGTLCISAPAQAQFTKGYKFLEAVDKKEGAEVEEAISQPGSTIINSRDVTTGRGALHIVTERRDLTWLRYLVSKGANVNLRDDRGVAPLQLATSLGWIEGVEFLVSKNAKVDESDDTGETPLISAVHRKNAAMVRALLKGGADPNRADNSGRTALDYARLLKKDQLVTLLTTQAKSKAQGGTQAVYGPSF